MELVNVFFVFYLFIVIWYSYLLYVLRTSKNKLFQNAYFLMFVVIGIHDIILGLATLHNMRIATLIRIGLGSKTVYAILAALTHSELCLHIAGNLCMSTYQFTGVWRTLLHNRLWSIETTVWILAVLHVLAYALTAHLLFIPYDYKYNIHGDPIGFIRTEDIPKTRLFNGIMFVICVVITVVLTCVIYFGAYTKTREETRKNIPEKSIFLISVVQVFFYSYVIWYQIMQYLNIQAGDSFLLNIFLENFHALFFLSGTLNAFALPVLSKTLRVELVGRWWPDRILAPPTQTTPLVLTRRSD